MKQKIKTVLKYFFTFISIIIIFLLLLFLISLFPSSLIKENVKESSNILVNEGNYYRFSKYLSIINNNYSDALMINEAYSIDNTSPLFSCLAIRKNYDLKYTTKEYIDTNGELVSMNNLNSYDTVGELQDFLDGKVTSSIEYARYWHGYLVFLRQLLIFFNVKQIRFVLLFIFTILIITQFILIKKRFNIIVALIFTFSLLLNGYFFVSYSLESAPIFILMMISTIFLLINIDKVSNLNLFFFIIGCIANYVDYLTVPLITIAIPLFLWILYNQSKNDYSLKSIIKEIIIYTVLWLVGYSITWLSKWLLFDILYNRELFSSALKQIAYRSNVISSSNQSVFIVILNFLAKGVFDISFGIFLSWIFIYFFGKKYNIQLNKESISKIIIPFFIVSIYPFIWYTVLANHTIRHTIFVYRHMTIFYIGILLILYKFLIIKRKNT